MMFAKKDTFSIKVDNVTRKLESSRTLHGFSANISVIIFSKTFKNSSEKMTCLQLCALFNFQICGTFLLVG